MSGVRWSDTEYQPGAYAAVSEDEEEAGTEHVVDASETAGADYSGAVNVDYSVDTFATGADYSGAVGVDYSDDTFATGADYSVNTHTAGVDDAAGTTDAADVSYVEYAYDQGAYDEAGDAAGASYNGQW